MTISTASFYNRSTAAMQALTAQADRINTQIATGKKNAAPSDDSVSWQRLQGIHAAAADDTAYGSNIDTAQAVLSQADTTLTAITDQLTRARELATQAATGTYSGDDRKALGTELAGIVDTIAGLANTTDARGQPLFGGQDGGQAVTKNTDGSYSYATTTGSPIPIGAGQSVQTGETAQRLLSGSGTDMLAMLSALATSLSSGTSDGTDASDALTGIDAASKQVTDVQTSLGARAARVDIEQSRLKDVATDRETLRSSLEDDDYTASIAQLQQTMTVLSATQASFSKLSSLSLFDYLK